MIKRRRIIFIFMIFLVLIVTGFIIKVNSKKLAGIELNHKQNFVKKSKLEIIRASDKLEIKLKNIIDDTKTLVKAIETNEIKKENLKIELEKILKKNRSIYGMGVSFVPNLNIETKRVDSPYYISRDFNEVLNEKTFEIYKIPIFHKNGKWHKKVLIGEVFVDYLREEIKKDIDELDVGKSGYAFLVDDTGRFLSHPVENLVNNKYSVFDSEIIKSDSNFEKLSEMMKLNSKGEIYLDDIYIGKTSYLFYTTLKEIKWKIVGVFVEKRTYEQKIRINKLKLETFFYCTILFLLIVILTLTIFTKLSVYRLVWKSVIIFSIFILVNVCYIWILANDMNYQKNVKEIILTEKSTNENYLKKTYTDQYKKELSVPYGFYIETIQFNKADLYCQGLIWQKYTKELDEKVKIKKPIIPQLKNQKIIEIDKKDYNDYILYTYRFEGNLKNNYELKKYPFDNLKLSLKLKNYNDEIVYIPDYISYDYLNSDLLPGISKNINLKGWKIISSYFSYKELNSNNTFGKKVNLSNREYPDLSFSVVFKRQFINAFVGYILPSIIVLGILFVVVLFVEEFPVAFLIRSLTSLIFIITLSHIRLRTDISSTVITYPELLFLLTYVFILFVIVSFSFIYSLKLEEKLRRRIMSYMKVVFYPVTSIIILGITYFNYM